MTNYIGLDRAVRRPRNDERTIVLDIVQYPQECIHRFPMFQDPDDEDYEWLCESVVKCETWMCYPPSSAIRTSNTSYVVYKVYYYSDKLNYSI